MYRAPYEIRDRKIRFAVVGCGRISKNHFDALEKHQENADLVAVCDSNAVRLDRSIESYGVEGYSSLTQLLAESDADVVSICTPSGLHPEEAIETAHAARHIVTEKPMAITLKDADEMIEACHRAGVKLGVIFQRRVQGIFLKVKKALEEGELGRVVLGDIYMKYYRSQQYYDSGAWRGTWKFDGGGALMNQGIHLIDLLQWYMGPVGGKKLRRR